MAHLTAPATTTPIVALDVPSADAALALVDRIGDACRFYKVGNELFTAAGPDVVRRLVGAGLDVFLDLKFHDIPNTVAGGVRRAAALGARLVTVHASGGRAMLDAAVRAGAEEGGERCGVLAVTVLTSLDAGALAAAWGRESVDVRAEVLRLAGDAAAAGAHGVVCSGQELPAVRERHGDRLAALVPGVRRAADAVGDQARVVTPAAAAAAGARYIVVGRPVTAASDPSAAMRAISLELGEGAASA